MARLCLLQRGVLLLLLLCFLVPSSRACVGPRTASELADQLWGPGSGYGASTRPSLASRTNFTALTPKDDIAVQIEVFRVRTVNMQLQVFEVELFFRTMWTDPRLKYNSTAAGGCLGNEDVPNGEVAFGTTELAKIWTPGIGMPFLDHSETILSNVFWVYPSGFVWNTKRSILQLTCKMNLENLPYDVQVCPLRLQTLRDTSSLTMRFHKDTPSKMSVTGGTLEWELTEISGRDMTDGEMGLVYGGAGLIWNFRLRHRPTYYERYIMAPCILTVGIAWCSFFIAREAAPARVSMVVICFLSISTLISAVLTSLPIFGGYVWLLALLLGSQQFVFVAVFQFGACQVIDKINAHLDKVRAQKKASQQNAQQLTQQKTMLRAMATAPAGSLSRKPKSVALTVRMPETNANKSSEDKGAQQSRSPVKAWESPPPPTTEADPKTMNPNDVAGLASLILNSSGHIRIKAYYLDVLFRIAFPIAYGVFLIVLYDWLPDEG